LRQLEERLSVMGASPFVLISRGPASPTILDFLSMVRAEHRFPADPVYLESRFLSRALQRSNQEGPGYRNQLAALEQHLRP